MKGACGIRNCQLQQLSPWLLAKVRTAVAACHNRCTTGDVAPVDSVGDTDRLAKVVWATLDAARVPYAVGESLAMSWFGDRLRAAGPGNDSLGSSYRSPC